jgi:iron complex outermembrane receptor protein
MTILFPITTTLRDLPPVAAMLLATSFLSSPAMAADPGQPIVLALAEAASAESSYDIVVTARRREESAQDVPIALTAIGAAEIQNTGNYTLSQFQQLAPSLQVFGTNPRNTNINIRGIGSNVAVAVDGLDNGVGVYVDQVFIGRVGPSSFDLVDLDRIEVLRGPQGTLFGKNTTAGAISITSRAPSFDPEFAGELSIGDYGYHQIRASGSGALVDDLLAVRLSVADTHRDGFIKNTRIGQRAQDYDNTTYRAQLLFTPDPDLSIRVIGDYGRQFQRGMVQPVAAVFTALDNGTPIANNILTRLARLGYTLAPIDPFGRKVDADSYYQIKMKQWGASAIVDWTIPGHLLTSVTAYRKWDWLPRNDADWLGVPVLTAAHVENHQKQFSQELRLASTGTRAIDYVVGAYYFWQIINGVGLTQYGSAAPSWFLGSASTINNAVLNGFGIDSTLNPETHSLAAFGQATWHATDRLSVTGGLRFTHEKKQGAFVQTPFGSSLDGFSPAEVTQIQTMRNNFARPIDYSATRKDDSLSGTLNIAYKATDDILTYATYSRGSKSGGLNLSALPAGIDPQVRPEKVNHYELGLKSEFLDHKVTFNLAAFWTEIGDYQSSVTATDTTFGFRQYIANIEKARTRGFEADARVEPVEGLNLSASGAYIDATYRSYKNAPCPPEAPNQPSRICDLSGKRLAGASKYAASLAADYSHPISGGIEGYGRVDYSYRSSYYSAVSNSRYSKVPGYGLTNLRLGVRAEGGRWDLSVWARNLFDKDYFQILSPADTGLVTSITGDPRTLGATIRTKL